MELRRSFDSRGQPLDARDRPLIFLAGDSSLDNKYWLGGSARPIGGYERVLDGDMMKDVCYHITKESLKRSGGDKPSTPVCLNTSVEATTLSQRSCGRLLAQDKFIRDNIQPQDTLIVSIGGNDIALAPAPCTVVNMLGLMYCTPMCCLENGFGRPIPVDDCCLGCGAGCLSTLTACPPCGGYFLHLFKVRIESYLKRLLAKTRPRHVAVCMIYYPDTNPREASWADRALGLLGYDRNPKKLQVAIRKIFELAVSEIKISGVEKITPIPLFEVMNGTDTRDYVARVEPSEKGGRKMAEFILDRLEMDNRMVRE
ncbi:hypothetical protein TrRE_jg11656 [Triparma retinervis]|uniref:Uncharacterized protein n=1 Tax=Triparma retinervis TaxID=2557542 RepID=A0A9W7E8X2_9STRA|nr:hypothetical protein TrRE_jg11656 [Triparma retinervis]